MLSSEEGGRKSPVIGGVSYRPNHNFLGPENREMGMGFIELPAGELFHPGDSRAVELTLYPWPEDIDLSPGREWRIQEGGHLVAIATVVEVLAGER